jgi:hypothetical protein
MQRNVVVSDPWRHAISMLERFVDPTPHTWDKEAGCRGTARARDRRSARKNNALLKIVDHRSDTTLSVCWFDSTYGRYGDQIWSLRCARTSGTCVLSGRTVRKGDHVFQPRTSTRPPVNANEMILSSALRSSHLPARSDF